MKAHMRVGIDFDNTIISYDEVFRSVARDWGLIDDGVAARKQPIRDHIRVLPDGELIWQRLQGYVYGKGISGARMFDGVDSFLSRCRSEDCAVLIISHKTQFGHFDPDSVNLREAALGWMDAHGFFHDGGYDIRIENVYFEESRAEKVARIAALDCTCFIDDLEEVLGDPAFPVDVAPILFSERAKAADRFAAFSIWKDIEEHLFRDRR
jgi:hypothetical protein